MNTLCDCFRPLSDTSHGSHCQKCGLEVMDRRCEVCQTDFDATETEERSDGKLVCKSCYKDSLEFND